MNELRRRDVLLFLHAAFGVWVGIHAFRTFVPTAVWNLADGLPLYLKGGIAIGVQLLGIASAFQLFDGLQVTTTGALRGLGETRVPMLVSLVGYWISGLPLGWWLCFRGGYGVHGLWIGLAASLALVGTALLVLWRVRIGQAARAQAPIVVTA